MTDPRESLLPLEFPSKGIDVSVPNEEPAADTTDVGVNVRFFESVSERGRGGSRSGLSRYIDDQLPGVVQDLNVIVSVAGEAMGGFLPFDGWSTSWPYGWLWEGSGGGPGEGGSSGQGGFPPVPDRPPASETNPRNIASGGGGLVLDSSAIATDGTVAYAAKGAFQREDVHDTLTCPAITAATGDLMVVCIGTDSVVGAPTVSWGAETLTEIVQQPGNATVGHGYIFCKLITAGGVQDLTIVHTTSTDRITACTISCATGIGDAGVYSTNSAAGAGTAPNSGNLIGLIGSAGIAFGAVIWFPGPPPGSTGVWDNLTEGQNAPQPISLDLTLQEGYAILGVGTIVAASKTGADNLDWIALAALWDA